MLFHIAERARWEATADSYTVPSLQDEGFVHCSTRAQVGETALRYYAGRTDLVLLEIDPDRLGAVEVRWEPAPPAESFPHVYGPIAAAAVVAVHPFLPDADGRFPVPDPRTP